MNATQTQQDYYEKYWLEGAKGYSGENQGYAPNLIRWMGRQLASLPPGARILEAGCGDASFTKHLTKFSKDVTAIDISESQVRQNTRVFPGIKFLQHDLAVPMPFPDGSFDVIWCSEVLEHLFDPIFAVAEMHRAMAPGGRLLVTVPYHGTFKNVLIALFKWDEHFTPSNPHIRFYTTETLRKMVQRAGFDEIQMETCGMNVPVRDWFVPTNILLRAVKPSRSS